MKIRITLRKVEEQVIDVILPTNDLDAVRKFVKECEGNPDAESTVEHRVVRNTSEEYTETSVGKYRSYSSAWEDITADIQP